MKTISKSQPRIPNENNVTTPQTTSALEKIKKDSMSGSRSVLLCVELNPTTAVIRKPPIEEKEKEKDEDEGEEEDEDDDDGNTPPPANSNNERLTYLDISSELEEIQEEDEVG